MEVGETEALEEVGRILHSSTLRNADTLRRLLEYLTRKSVSGDADQLKEYTIGIEAFGKPESYDPRHDSIVRLQVSRLREKIAQYYQTEGQADRVLVDLPKGGFKVIFQPRIAQSAAAAAARARTWRLVALLLGVALAAVSTFTIVSLRARVDRDAATWNPELEAFWEPILRSERPPLVCIGTPLFVRLTFSRYFRDSQVNEQGDIERSELIAAVKKALRVPDVIPWTNFTGVGEATAAFHLATLLAWRRPDLLLTTSSRLSWDVLSSHNVIFVGPPKFNRQLKDLRAGADLVMELDGIHNLRPGPEEPAIFRDHWAPSKLDGEIYGLISRLPGLHGRGFVFVFAGSTGPETEAAVESLTDRQQAAALAKRIRLPSGDLPMYFQILIRVQFKNLVPVKTSYVLHRILTPVEYTSAER
jgi:hypothetical protein